MSLRNATIQVLTNCKVDVPYLIIRKIYISNIVDNSKSAVINDFYRNNVFWKFVVYSTRNCIWRALKLVRFLWNVYQRFISVRTWSNFNYFKRNWVSEMQFNWRVTTHTTYSLDARFANIFFHIEFRKTCMTPFLMKPFSLLIHVLSLVQRFPLTDYTRTFF